MSFKTDGSVEIEAPAQSVFDWLVSNEKLETWVGGDSTLMPDDPSQLRVGFRSKGTLQAPEGKRPIEMEVTAYDPPREFAFRLTYDGGGSTSVYTLDEEGSRTKLEVRNDTDMAAPAPIPEELKKQIEDAPFIGKMLGKLNLGKLEEAMAKMADNPLVEAAMDKELDASLEKLKKLVEDGK